MKQYLLPLLFFILTNTLVLAQPYWLGADLSYANEMEDCGANYKASDDSIQDIYTLFAQQGCQLVRLRLWHTPSWQDTLNNNQRYSDFEDVKRSIMRSREAGMQSLLDFHLSDFWADPSRQWIPEAWLPVAGNLPLLQDSLYQYIYRTLTQLHSNNLLPEMIQIGNETNREILQTIEANAANNPINWPRNAALFNTAIQAVRDFEEANNQSIKIILHIAGPSEVQHFVQLFNEHGVTDFDIIGISYYWQWHQPTTIEQLGTILANLVEMYPEYEPMIVETGYHWTSTGQDAANNILYQAAPGYEDISPSTQLQWLTDMTQTALNNGAIGIIYWEPAWVSTSCHTPWGYGSHYENATFFDFNHQTLHPGGVDWFSQNYTSTKQEDQQITAPTYHYSDSSLTIQLPDDWPKGKYQLQISNELGSILFYQEKEHFSTLQNEWKIYLPQLTTGIYFLHIYKQDEMEWVGKLMRP